MRITLHPEIYLLSVFLFVGCVHQSAKEQKAIIAKDSGNTLQAVDTTAVSMNRKDSSSNPQYLEALRFLATIRKTNVEEMGRKNYIKQFPGYSVDSFLGYFSKAKFSISNMEKGDKDIEPYSMEELR